MSAPRIVSLCPSTTETLFTLGVGHRVVGRAAAAILAREEDALHVRLVASHAHRVRLAMAEHGVSEAEASAIVNERDTNRARYHKEMYGRDWDDPVNYHLVLNTELLGIEGV